MPTPPPSAARAVRRAAGLAVAVAVIAPAVAQADTPDYCVNNSASYSCPAGTIYDAASFAALQAYWDAPGNAPSNGSSIQVEPSATPYTGQVDLHSAFDLDIYGDPAVPQYYPVITSATGPTVTVAFG